MPQPLMVFPVKAPVQTGAFDLIETIVNALAASGEALQDGDVLALSSKYAAISEGRVVTLADVQVSDEAEQLAGRYHMNPRIAQLVLQQADHIFGGIHGFLMTYKDGIMIANAGIDRSNIPSGYAVVFPEDPYRTAAHVRHDLQSRLGVTIGLVLTDSWLMPVRWGTTGVALATAGFRPMQDERGKHDLFGNPMQVTVRGIADAICSAAQLVMGERDEATPLAIVRNTGVEMVEVELSPADVAIDWNLCIYVQSLTEGAIGNTVQSTAYRVQSME